MMTLPIVLVTPNIMMMGSIQTVSPVDSHA